MIIICIEGMFADKLLLSAEKLVTSKLRKSTCYPIDDIFSSNVTDLINVSLVKCQQFVPHQANLRFTRLNNSHQVSLKLLPIFIIYGSFLINQYLHFYLCVAQFLDQRLRAIGMNLSFLQQLLKLVVSILDLTEPCPQLVVLLHECIDSLLSVV